MFYIVSRTKKICTNKYFVYIVLFIFTSITTGFFLVESIFQPRIEINNNIPNQEKIINDFFSVYVPQFAKEKIEAKRCIVLVVVDTLNFFDSFSSSAIRGHLYFKNNDSYIEYYVKKSNFGNDEGNNFSPAKKEALVKKTKEYIEILLKKSKYVQNAEITKLIKYKDKVEILFK